MARLFSDESSQYLRTDQAILTAVPLSFAVWVYIDEASLQTYPIVITDADGGSYFSINFWSDYNVYATCRDATTYSEAVASAQWTVGSWYHAVGVYAATNSRAIYLNGGNKGTNTATRIPVNLDTTTIGARLNSGSVTNYHSGMLAEVAIYNTALTDDEAAILAKGVSPLAVRPGNLVFYVPLVRDNDEDIVGGVSMTAYNTPTIAEHPRIYYPFTPFYYMVSGAEPPADLSIDIGLDEAAYQGTGVRII